MHVSPRKTQNFLYRTFEIELAFCRDRLCPGANWAFGSEIYPEILQNSWCQSYLEAIKSGSARYVQIASPNPLELGS